MPNDALPEKRLFKVRVLLPVDEAQELWSSDEPLEAIIGKLREAWQEDVKPDGTFGDQVIAVLRDGRTVAILTRGAEAAICHTLYVDGKVESHRCHYVIGPLGYERTEISKL